MGSSRSVVADREGVTRLVAKGPRMFFLRVSITVHGRKGRGHLVRLVRCVGNHQARSPECMARWNLYNNKASLTADLITQSDV